MLPAIAARQAELAAICRRFHVRRLDVFGSAARGTDFVPGRSDADLLVEFEPTHVPSFADYLALQDALQQTLGIAVDVVDRAGIERSRNEIRRRAILDGAQPLYAA